MRTEFIILAIAVGILVWNDAKALEINHIFWGIVSTILFPIGPIGYLFYRFQLK